MKAYKLTTLDNRTRVGESNEMLWGENITHSAKKGEGPLCTDKWIHAYEDPLIAVFMNPIQGQYNPKTMKLWEVELGGKIRRDGQLKCGAKICTTLKEIPLPIISLEKRVEIARRISIQAYNELDDVSAKWAESAAWVAESAMKNNKELDLLSIIKAVVNAD
jgi:hypothetical protein